MKISNNLFKLALAISLVSCGGDKKSGSEGGQDNPNSNSSGDATGSLVAQGIGAINEGVDFSINKLDYDFKDNRDLERNFRYRSAFKQIVRGILFGDSLAGIQCKGPDAVVRKSGNEFFGQLKKNKCKDSVLAYVSYEAAQYQKCDDSYRIAMDSHMFAEIGLTDFKCKSGEYMAKSVFIQGTPEETVTNNLSVKSTDGKTCKFEEEDGNRKSLNDCVIASYVSDADQEDYRGINERFIVKEGFIAGENTLGAKGKVIVERAQWRIEFTFPGEGKDLIYKAVGPNATLTGTLVLASHVR